MNFTVDRVITIKCALADIDKSKLANELGMNASALSRRAYNDALLKRVYEYFEKTNPEVNKLFNKLTENNPDMVAESSPRYLKKTENDIIADLIDVLKGQLREKDHQIEMILTNNSYKQAN